MSDAYVNLIYHIVFSTKNREPFLTEAHQPELYDYVGGIVRNRGGISLGVNGTADHVHVLAKLRQDKSLSDVIRDLKAGARWWISGFAGFFLAKRLRSIYDERFA